MSRYGRSEVDFDVRYDDRRSTAGPRGTRTESRHEDIDIDFRRGSGPVPAKERRSILVKERDDISERRGTTPAFLRDDYAGNTTSGAMVLRGRDTEDITYAPRRRRSVSRDREEIIIRRDERESKPAPSRARGREQSREREEIIIRRDERSQSRPAPPRPREQSLEREEIIIRRDSRSESRPAPSRIRERSRDREEIIIRRDDRESFAPPRRVTTAPVRESERDREEIIIRRDDRSRYEDYRPPPPQPREPIDRSEIIIRREQFEPEEPPPPPRRSRYEEDIILTRGMSRERVRSRAPSRDSFSEDEIIIRRDERENRGREETREEIIIRRSSVSRSPSPAASVSTRAAPTPAPAPPPEPQIIYAPQIHQEVITHHRHVDHGYEVRNSRRENMYSRPPSPPSPPPPPPPPAPVSVRARSRSVSEERIEIKRSQSRSGRRETEDIIISRNERSESRGPPPRVAEQDFSYKRYDWSRRSKFYSDGDDEGYTTDPGRPAPAPTIAARYANRRDPRDGLWTEVTKDLVVKEAIQEMGWEFQETENHYYIFRYMEYADVARLVGLSEDIKKDRLKRINEIRWENAARPRPAIEPTPPRLAIEGPPPRRDRGGWDREDERYIEREIIYRGGRPPPPPGWGRR